MCFWGPTRRYEYFEYLHMGMHQQAAFRNAKEHKKAKDYPFKKK